MGSTEGDYVCGVRAGRGWVTLAAWVKSIVPVGSSPEEFAEIFAALGPFGRIRAFLADAADSRVNHSLIRTTVMAIFGKIGNKPIYSN